MYYFAYGSNMDENDLKDWCDKKGLKFPEWKFHGVACLEGYQLTFNYYSKGREGGAANIMNKHDSKVYGLLFEVTDKYGHEILRKKEGYPDYYDEIKVNLLCRDRIIKDVMTYKVVSKNEKSEHQKPTRFYMNLILQNALKHGLPIEYIKYLENIETK